MGVKLAELEEGSNLIILASNDDGKIEFEANLVKHVKEDIALISINLDRTTPLEFGNVKVEIEYVPEEGIPFIWHNAKMHTVKSQYVLQVVGEAMRNNRRGCFRVGVSKTARLRRRGMGDKEVIVRDVSLSGFGLTDRKKELLLRMGDEGTIIFEDMGHSLNLAGKVVRIDEQEEFTLYGFSITNMCKDLSSYISVKQRQNRNA